MAGNPFLSVVIPAYNEAANIQAGALRQVAEYLSRQSYPYEILVVDDGSQDDTVRLAEEFAAEHPCFTVLRMPHRGKAYTVAAGLLAAQGEIVLFTDMDQATPIRETARLLPWFEQGYDIVIGSRGTARRNAPWWRRFMSLGQIVLRDVLLGFRGLRDTQCGFKAFRRTTIRPILSRLALYAPRRPTAPGLGPTVTSGFDVELLFVAHKLGYRIREAPVEWDYRRTRRVNLLKDSLRGVRDLVRIRWTDRRGEYDRPGDIRKLDID